MKHSQFIGIDGQEHRFQKVGTSTVLEALESGSRYSPRDRRSHCNGATGETRDVFVELGCFHRDCK